MMWPPIVACLASPLPIDTPVASRLVRDLEPGEKSFMREPPSLKVAPRTGENSVARPMSFPLVLARKSDALDWAVYAAISPSSMNLPRLSVFKYLRLFLAQVNGL